MKILVLNASPKGERSNTMQLTRAFLDGLNENCENTVELLSTQALNIAPCKGCFACWNKTPGKCCMQDDMAMVLEKMLWADITIWSFPLYFFSVPGPLKNIIDRQLPLSLPFMNTESESGGHPSRYDMSDKRTVLISTCGFYTAKGNYDGVRSMFDHYKGTGNYETIFCGQGELFRVKELAERTESYLEKVRQAGREFAVGNIQKETRAELDTMLFSRETFEAMADASWGVDREGEKESEAKVFTRQMAALYNKASYPGHERILEMNYTDIAERYRILLEKDGSRLLRDEEAGEATTIINTPLTVWRAIAAGEIEGSAALMQHQYNVEGDFDLLLHWEDNFGEAAPKEERETTRKANGKSNMLILLLPWTALWVASAMNTQIGSLITLAVCALLPLLFYRNRKTIYDIISSSVVSACAISMLLGAAARVVLPLSYLAFGVLWGISCFLPIPLTAEYSMNRYGEEAALKNPIFIRTNRILTACWSCLYLITPIWTYVLMGAALAESIGTLNSLAPAALGIFTAWFQKWYPAKVARGNK